MYCVQASGQRVEKFDIEVVKDFLRDHYRVVIVFTKADSASKEDVQDCREVFEKAFGDNMPSCIPVCSVEKKLIAGANTKPFGRDQLRRAIVKGFWESICFRLPRRCVSLLEEKVEEWHQQRKSYLDQNYGIFNIGAIQKTFEKEMKEFENKLGGEQGLIAKVLKDETEHILEAYETFSRLLVRPGGEQGRLSVGHQQIKPSARPAVQKQLEVDWGYHQLG